ncbi:MAG: MFS transporter [Chloroflexi bacterium]|nr:MFS transporter [Chloroflexota bacterium]
MTARSALSRVATVAGGLDPALAVLAFIGFISQVGISVMLPLLPLFASELGATPFVLGLLTSSFAVTNAIGQLGTGFLVDRFGSRRLMSAGVGLYAAMNALIATSAAAPWLIAWRSLAGFGGGAMIVSERVYVTEVTHPARRAFASGIISAAQSAGTVMGPVVGGLAASIGGLRAPFALVATTSAIAFVGTLFLRRPRVVDASARDDDAAVGEGVPYRSLALLLVANLAIMASYGAFITSYGPMATDVLGWSTLDVGIAFSFFGAGSILLGPPLGHIADRYGRRPVAAWSTVPIAAFSLSLVLGLPQIPTYATAILAGAGITGYNASWFALLADVAGERRRGRTFGIVSGVSNAGIVVGALAAAELWSRVDIAAAQVFAIGAALAAGAALIAFRPPPGAGMGTRPA